MKPWIFKWNHKTGVSDTFDFIFGSKFLDCLFKKCYWLEPRIKNQIQNPSSITIIAYEWTGRDLSPSD